MFYSGIDLHKDNSFITTINEAGDLVQQERVLNVPEALLAYFARLGALYTRLARRSNEAVARTVVAKEIARIVYYILKNKSDYRGLKGLPISRHKSLQWPRVASPNA